MKKNIGRQAIFDRNKDIYAYELLYRNGKDNSCVNLKFDNELATLTVISNIFSIGMNNITEGKRGFINIPYSLLKYDIINMLPNDLIVVEMLEFRNIDNRTLDICKRLKESGYIIALDDFTITDLGNPIVELIDIIKVDFKQEGFEGRKKIIDKIGSKKMKFLAEKVETRDDFEKAVDMGYSYFQGYYLRKPEIISSDI